MISVIHADRCELNHHPTTSTIVLSYYESIPRTLQLALFRCRIEQRSSNFDMMTTNQSFQYDDDELLYYDSGISFSESLTNLDYGDDDGLLLLDDAAGDVIEPLELSTAPVDHNDINAYGNDSRNDTLEPPKQIVYYPSPQYQIDNSTECKKQIQMLQTQLAYARYEYLCLHAHTQVSLSHFYQLVYCLPPLQPMVKNTQSGDEAVIVIAEPSAEQTDIGCKMGRPRGRRDRHKRNHRRCKLCMQYENISANEKSNIWTCKGRMGGKNGGRKACQYFECNGQRKRRKNVIGS